MNLVCFQQTHVAARIDQAGDLKREAGGHNTENLQLPNGDIRVDPLMQPMEHISQRPHEFLTVVQPLGRLGATLEGARDLHASKLEGILFVGAKDPIETPATQLPHGCVGTAAVSS
jgi:hypothetical protein